jgi:molecular chaperone HtpG
MVADKVEVESKSALDTKTHKWISDGKSGFEIEEIERISEDENLLKKSSDNHSLTRGTKIILYVNEANKELLEEWKLRDLIKKYSNYIQVPIMMRKYDNRTEEDKKKEPNKLMEFEQVNETKPIWEKDKKDIKPKEYKEFYQNLTYDWNEPLFTIHNNVE